MPRSWSALAHLAGCCALAVAVCALISRQSDTSWQPLIIAAAAAHQLLWAGPLAVLLFAVVRRWRLVAVAVIVAAVGGLSQLPLYTGAAATPAARELTVLQSNLRVGQADPANLVRLVRADQVDLLTTEELTPTERDRLLAAGLARLLPYRFDAALAGGGGGLAIWSRYPLSAEVNYPGFQLGVLRATIRLNATETATVFAVHLLPPYPYPSREWLAEVGRLRPLLASATGPVVVAGDFNATADQAQFRHLLSSRYQDAAERVGAGYLASYPTDRWFPPLLAIDHVLSTRMPATAASMVALPGSDHRGLLVRLSLPQR